MKQIDTSRRILSDVLITFTIFFVDNLGSWINDFPLSVPAGTSPVVAYLRDSIIVYEI